MSDLCLVGRLQYGRTERHGTRRSLSYVMDGSVSGGGGGGSYHGLVQRPRHRRRNATDPKVNQVRKALGLPFSCLINGRANNNAQVRPIHA